MAAHRPPSAAASALSWPPSPNLVTAFGPGSEPEQRAVGPVRDPDAAVGSSQRGGLAAEGYGRRDDVAPWIHPVHGRVERIEHPQPGRGRHYSGGCVTDANRVRNRAGPGIDPYE